MKISPSKEDYIRAIHNLNGATTKVSNKSIAEELSVSAASVTEMNNRLVKEDLISHYPYRGVQLTKKGILAANRLIRKHRIWEVFLHEKLGYRWGEVHQEADRLEHASSDELIERLSEFLGHPEFDPHGERIPNADGSTHLPYKEPTSLSEIKIGTMFIVKEVVDDKKLLEYLYQKNLSLNHSYQLTEINSYDQTTTLLDLQSNKKISISKKATQNIKVEEIKSTS